MSDVIQIYEFSRAFDNPHWSEKLRQWVSGGYLPEKINRSSQDVPPEILEYVKKNYFAINDNYCPLPGDVALIAREIGYYAVLAVANLQTDDGYRQTLGYRYFWLEQTATNWRKYDGILILLYWWEHAGKPMFDIKEASDPKPAPHNFSNLYEYEDWSQKYCPEIKEVVNRVSRPPMLEIARKARWQDYEEYFKLHWETREISSYFDKQLAWAWNAEKLHHPSSFLCIYYADTKDNRAIVDASKNQPPSGSTTLSPPSSGMTTTSNFRVDGEHFPDPIPEQKIRTCLLELARTFTNRGKLDTQKTHEFFRYLTDYPNEDWSIFVDKIALNNNSSTTPAYKALLYLVIPDDQRLAWLLSELLNSLETGTASWFKFMDSPTENIALELHQALLEDLDLPKAVRERFETAIYTGISHLLNRFLTKYGDSKCDQERRQIQYLLLKSNSVWSRCFQEYAKSADHKIVSLLNTLNSISRFYINLTRPSRQNSPTIKDPEDAETIALNLHKALVATKHPESHGNIDFEEAIYVCTSYLLYSLLKSENQTHIQEWRSNQSSQSKPGNSENGYFTDYFKKYINFAQPKIKSLPKSNSVELQTLHDFIQNLDRENTSYQQTWEALKKLLLQPEMKWSEHFEIYASDIPKPINSFCEGVASDTKDIKCISTAPRRRGRDPYEEYKALASLFKEANHKELSTWLDNLNGKPPSEPQHRGVFKALFCVVIFLMGVAITVGFLFQGNFIFALLIAVAFIVLIVLVLKSDFSYHPKHINHRSSVIFVTCLAAGVLVILAIYCLHFFQSPQTSEDITTDSAFGCQPRSVEDARTFQTCAKDAPALQDQEIERRFIPDPKNPYVKDQIRIARDYLDETSDRNKKSGNKYKFLQRIKKLEDCKAKTMQTPNAFGACVKGLYQQPANSAKASLSGTLKGIFGAYSQEDLNRRGQ